MLHKNGANSLMQLFIFLNVYEEVKLNLISILPYVFKFDDPGNAVSRSFFSSYFNNLFDLNFLPLFFTNSIQHCGSVYELIIFLRQSFLQVIHMDLSLTRPLETSPILLDITKPIYNKTPFCRLTCQVIEIVAPVATSENKIFLKKKSSKSCGYGSES